MPGDTEGPGAEPEFDAARLRELADEGLRLRRELDERIKRMTTLTAEDLRWRSD